MKKGAKAEFFKFLTLGAFFKTCIKQFLFSKISVFIEFFGQKFFRVLIALYAKFDCKCAKEMLSLIEQKENDSNASKFNGNSVRIYGYGPTRAVFLNL